MGGETHGVAQRDTTHLMVSAPHSPLADAPLWRLLTLLLLLACRDSMALWTGRLLARTTVQKTQPLLADSRRISALRQVVDGASELKTYSFTQDTLKPYAMSLHTKDQVRHGGQPAQRHYTTWQPSRQDFLQFLVDSLVVYEAFESIIDQVPELEQFRGSGLERVGALRHDIAWVKSLDTTLVHPPVNEHALKYVHYLHGLAPQSVPRFVCHYYNFYFAHTSGGRMIGKRLADVLLDGASPRFYQWPGPVTQLVDAVKAKIDALAAAWSADERQECLNETRRSFQFGADILRAITPADVKYVY